MSSDKEAAEKYTQQFSWNDPREEDAVDAFIAGCAHVRNEMRWREYPKEKPEEKNQTYAVIRPLKGYSPLVLRRWDGEKFIGGKGEVTHWKEITLPEITND